MKSLASIATTVKYCIIAAACVFVSAFKNFEVTLLAASVLKKIEAFSCPNCPEETTFFENPEDWFDIPYGTRVERVNFFNTSLMTFSHDEKMAVQKVE